VLREHRKAIDKINIVLSGIIILTSFYIWYYINEYLSPSRLESFDRYIPGILVFIAVVLFSMIVKGVSPYARFISIFNILKEIFSCYVFGALAFGLFTYLFKVPHISRFFLMGGVSFSYLALISFLLISTLIYRGIRLSGLNYQSVILIGNEYTLPQFIKTIENNKFLGLRILGVMTLEELDRKNLMGHKYLGGIDNIRKVLNSEAVDYVIFTVYRQNPTVVEKTMLICQERGIDTWFKPDFMQKIMLPRIDYLDEIPLFVISFSPKSPVQLGIKRFFDIIVSFILLLILAIPMLVISALIRATTKGPVIFRQKRVGLNGRIFTMYKFRTMYTSAQQRRSEYRLKNEMKGPVFKMKCDPRVTKIGCLLRRYSLDELPQFFNVLKGEMSIVGPRPPLPSEVNLYKGWHRRRLSMRPGITCIWQVTGRNKITDFEEWVKLDLKYIDTWSLWLDLKIFLKTIPAALLGTGY